MELAADLQSRIVTVAIDLSWNSFDCLDYDIFRHLLICSSNEHHFVYLIKYW